jgi:GTP-binding protein
MDLERERGITIAAKKLFGDEVYGILVVLDATEEQLDFSVLYANGKDGVGGKSPEETGKDLAPLFDVIIEELPPPHYHKNEPFQMLISDLSYSDFLGSLAIGKVVNGSARFRDSLVCIGPRGRHSAFECIESADAGDIVVLSGIEDIHIGDTICTRESPKALPRITVDEPTVAMRFTNNMSPLSGREGRYVQSSKIRERLVKETLKNVSIQLEDAEEGEGFIVKGRGSLLEKYHHIVSRG